MPGVATHAEKQTMKPKILIVTARRWFSAARLAMAFASEGCPVEIVCPSSHPVMLTRGIAARHSFYAFSPIRSLHSAIRKSLPALVVPTDELATHYLYRLYDRAPSINEGTSEFIRSLLQCSLGDPVSFAVLSSRAASLTAAQASGIPAVSSENLPDEAAIDRWLSLNPLPAVIKADGTSGGEGVSIVRTRTEAITAWRKLRAPLDLAHVIHKTGFERDLHHIVPWIMRSRRTVSIQPFISGRDANIAVACWKGELLGAISLDVLQTCRPKGPAALVELSQDEQMLTAARIIVKRLNLSGLCGFDFVTDDKSGRPYLVEINPRATQTCHLPYGAPRSLVPALVSRVEGTPLPSLNESRRRGIIALFPLAWQSGVSKEMLDSTHQDIPWEEPRLVKAGFAGKSKSFYQKYMHIRGRLQAQAFSWRE